MELLRGGAQIVSDDAIDIGCYVISYRVLAESDGQPDFSEAFQALNRTLGDKSWALFRDAPAFNVMNIGKASIYTMDIFVNSSALDILKLNDVIRGEVRVIEDRAITPEELAKSSRQRSG